jgi:hypothetical protein
MTSSFSLNSNYTSNVVIFGTVDNIEKVVTDQLRALPHEEYHQCYREWE